MRRRLFVQRVLAILGGWLAPLGVKAAAEGAASPRKRYGMGIQIDKCIGCGRCVEACKEENSVPQEPFYFRTWVERYVIKPDGAVVVQNIDERLAGLREAIPENDLMRSFFVPKLCNQCDHPPCVQVCPVGATCILAALYALTKFS